MREVIVMFSPNELALLIAEGMLGLNRPLDKTVNEIVADFNAEEKDFMDGCFRAARKVAEYLQKQVNSRASA